MNSARLNYGIVKFLGAYWQILNLKTEILLSDLVFCLRRLFFPPLHIAGVSVPRASREHRNKSVEGSRTFGLPISLSRSLCGCRCPPIRSGGTPRCPRRVRRNAPKRLPKGFVFVYVESTN